MKMKSAQADEGTSREDFDHRFHEHLEREAAHTADVLHLARNDNFNTREIVYLNRLISADSKDHKRLRALFESSLSNISDEALGQLEALARTIARALERNDPAAVAPLLGIRDRALGIDTKFGRVDRLRRIISGWLSGVEKQLKLPTAKQLGYEDRQLPLSVRFGCAELGLPIPDDIEAEFVAWTVNTIRTARGSTYRSGALELTAWLMHRLDFPESISESKAKELLKAARKNIAAKSS